MAAVGAVVGLLAPGWPTLTPVVDALFRLAFGLALPLVASRARRWSLLVFAGLAAAVAGLSVGAIFGWVALALALALVVFDVRQRALRGLIGLLGCVALFHLSGSTAAGVRVLVTALAVIPMCVSAYRLQRGRTRRNLRGALAVAGAVLGLVVAGFLVALVIGGSQADRGLAEARAGLTAARQGDTEGMGQHLSKAVADFRSAQSTFSSWYVRPARSLPLLGYQARALRQLSSSGRDLAQSARDASGRADYHSIKVVDGRIDIDKITALRAPLNEVAKALDQATERVGGIDDDWLVPPLADRVVSVRHELAKASDQSQTAIQAVGVAPTLLGADGARHYFVAFLNPAESRGLGGLMGNWALLTADHGKLSLTRSGRAGDLAWRAGDPPRILKAPAGYVARYGSFHPEKDLRDITLSPDFPSVAAAIEGVYPQTRHGIPVDGVLALDPYALAAMLKITGPVHIKGLPSALTSANAADYLLRRQYLEFDPTNQNKARIDVLDDAGRQTFNAFLHTKELRPAQLASVFHTVVQQHRLLALANGPAEESFLKRIGLDGTFPAYHGQGDFLSLVTQNAGNNKMDIYLHRSITYAATYDPATGAVDATATIRFHNDAPSSGLPAYVIADRPDSHQPDGVNWLSFNFYTPHLLTSSTLDGRALPMGGKTEFGLHVYQAYLPVPSRGDAVVVLRLQGRIAPSPTYRIGRFQQPMVHADRLTVEVAPVAPWRAAGHRGAQPVTQVFAPAQTSEDVALRRG